MKKIEKYTQEYLSGKALEEVSAELLEQLHDRQLRQRWQSKLADEHQVPRTKARSSKIRQLKPWLAVAATIALLVTVAYWWQPTPKNHQELLSQHLATPFANSEGRKNEVTVDSLRNQAILAYARRDFTTAAQLRRQVVAQDSTTTQEDYFYLGLSYLYQEPPQARAAIPYLQRASREANGNYTKESQWYLALAYLSAGENAAARAALAQIVAARQWPLEEAIELLEQMPE